MIDAQEVGGRGGDRGGGNGGGRMFSDSPDYLFTE